MRSLIAPFFDPATSTFTYVVADPVMRRAAVIDAVLDFDPKSARLATRSADAVLAYLAREGLTLDWILETHAHADHLTAAAYLRRRAGGRLGIGAGIRAVQRTFERIFDLGEEFRADGSQFDHLFEDGERFYIGSLEVRTLATPGHTSDSVTYLVDDAAFIGDTLFVPEHGSARCDFPGGDPAGLFESVQKLYALPEATRLFVCHDYPPAGREPRHAVSVAEQKRSNVHLDARTSREAFVAMRAARDASLATPVLMIPALQVNIRAGELPPPAANGVVYLKMPIDVIGRAA